MREQEENRLREQREAEERLLREQQEKLTPRPPQQPQLPVQPTIDPNQFTVQPHLYAVNFWVLLSNLITQCTNQKINMKYVDSTYSILSYETPEVKIVQMTRPDVYLCARKKDIKLFGSSLGVDVNSLSYNKTYDLAVCDAMIQSEVFCVTVRHSIFFSFRYLLQVPTNKSLASDITMDESDISPIGCSHNVCLAYMKTTKEWTPLHSDTFWMWFGEVLEEVQNALDTRLSTHLLAPDQGVQENI